MAAFNKNRYKSRWYWMNFKYYKISVVLVVIVILFASSVLVFDYFGKGVFQNSVWNTFLNATGPMALVVALFLAYDRHFWHVRFLEKMNVVPDLRGKYEGEITFSRNGKDQKKRCELTLHQTCSAIEIECVFLKEGEYDTSSKSDYVHLSCSDTSQYALSYAYHNEGAKMGHGQLQPHDGFNYLKVDIEPDRIILDGHYFTERRTGGKMRVVQVKSDTETRGDTSNEHK